MTSFLPLDGAQSPFIRERADGVLILLVSAENVLYLRTSAGPWRHLVGAGRDRQRECPAPAEIAPGGQGVFTMGYGTEVVNFRHSPFAGGETRVLNLLFGDNPPSSADMVLLGDGRLVVIFGDGEDTRWRVFGGGDAYDINAWAASGTVAGVSGAELVTGPRGTYLFDHRSLAAQRTGSFAAPFALRSLDTRRLRWRSVAGAGRRPQHLRHVDRDPGRARPDPRDRRHRRRGPDELRALHAHGPPPLVVVRQDHGAVPDDRERSRAGVHPRRRRPGRARLRRLAGQGRPDVGDAAAPGAAGSTGRGRSRATAPPASAATTARRG